MADNVVSCPHCSKPVVVPRVDEGKIAQIVSNALNSSTFCKQFPALCAKVASIETAMGSHPKPSKEFIRTQWENCPECHPAWDKIKKEIQEEALKSHHPVLGEELMNHFANCPECREQAEKYGIPLPEKVETQESFPWVQEEE